MPITQADIPSALLTTMRTEFLKALDENPGPQEWRDFTMEVPSTTDTETYAWLGNLPTLREFLGERVVHDMSESKKTLKNKTWEMTIGVKRSAWEDDKVGMIRMKVDQMAEAYMEWLNEQAFRCLGMGALTDATNPYGEAFDDAAFFADAHTLGVSTIDNLDIGGGKLAIATLQAAIGAMRAWKGDGGRWLNVNPTTLIVPPVLEWIARDLLTPAPGATAGQSMWGRLKLIVSPYMSDDTVLGDGSGNNYCWWLTDSSKQAKPIIYQKRTELEFTQLTQESDIGFMRDEWLFGVRVRCAFGYGAYWLAGKEVHDAA